MSKKEALFPDNYSRLSRFYLPAGTALFLLFALNCVYNHSWYVNNRALHFILTDLIGFLYGALILLCPFFLYPIMYFRGASPVERIFGSLVVVIAWYVKEIARMTDVYSFAQSLFYLLMPVQAGVLVVTLLGMSLSELLCRYYVKRRGLLNGPVFRPLPIAGLCISIAAILAISQRGGESYFFWFYDMYKWFFM